MSFCRSAHSNAYFYGFWKNKKIVLFDTLLEKGMLPTVETKEEGVAPEKEGVVPTEEGVATDTEGVVPTEEGVTTEKEGVVPTEEGVATEKEGVAAGSPPVGQAEGSGEEPKRKHQGCNLDEVLAVLAHELGHWKLSHTLKNLVIMEV